LIQKYEKSLGLGLGLENYGGLGLGLDNKVLFTSLVATELQEKPFLCLTLSLNLVRSMCTKKSKLSKNWKLFRP